MKLFVLFCLLGIVLGEEKYKTIDENFNVSELLGNERLLQAYARCLLDKGPCTPEVKQVKDKIPEVLETKCAKCTDKQKQMGKQLAKEVKKKHPKIWAELIAKYDPEGKYQESLREFIEI